MEETKKNSDPRKQLNFNDDSPTITSRITTDVMGARKKKDGGTFCLSQSWRQELSELKPMVKNMTMEELERYDYVWPHQNASLLCFSSNVDGGEYDKSRFWI